MGPSKVQTEKCLREQLLSHRLDQWFSNHCLQDLLKCRSLCPNPRVSDLIGPESSPRICISYKFSGVTDAVTLEDCFDRGEETSSWDLSLSFQKDSALTH